MPDRTGEAEDPAVILARAQEAARNGQPKPPGTPEDFWERVQTEEIKRAKSSMPPGSVARRKAAQDRKAYFEAHPEADDVPGGRQRPKPGPTVGDLISNISTDYAALPAEFQGADYATTRPQIGDLFADSVKPSNYQVPEETARQIVAGLTPSAVAQPINPEDVADKPKEKKDTPLWFKYTVGLAALVGVTFTVLKALGIF